MSSKKGKQFTSLTKLEMKRIREMRSIASSLDSPDLGVMYTAAGKLMAYDTGKSLLPKTFSLMNTTDATMRRLIFRTAGRNVYGAYVPDLFSALNVLNPAEREQVLQGIEEVFVTIGAPTTSPAVKVWIESISEVGREHQSTVFGLMIALGPLGIKWVTKRIKENVETIAYGTIPKLLMLPDKKRASTIQLLCKTAALKKMDLLPYVCGIVDAKTNKHLMHFLQKGNWQDRVHVAQAIGKLGITSSTGIVLDLIADPDWRVKQALLESANIHVSKLSSLLKVISYLVKDSHTRVRGQAERTLLTMGTFACIDSTLDVQRKKIEKRYRKQILHAASTNQDIDSSWLGTKIDKDPIPFLPEDTVLADEPLGVSLADIAPVEKAKKEEPKPASTLDLMAALKAARATASPETAQSVTKDSTDSEDKIDSSIPASEKFMIILKRLGGPDNLAVSLVKLKKHASTAEMSEEELQEAIAQLEKDGMIYKERKGKKIRRADMDF
ncbi:MAG: HEAT repeat domain-containing protein [Candidatus Thorarchaeota archaeon]